MSQKPSEISRTCETLPLLDKCVWATSSCPFSGQSCVGDCCSLPKSHVAQLPSILSTLCRLHGLFGGSHPSLTLAANIDFRSRVNLFASKKSLLRKVEGTCFWSPLEGEGWQCTQKQSTRLYRSENCKL